ncbi:MAG: ATP-dependent sacrificial sulfur transferase LarE [Candidatus Omnitrophota bacterium]|nr:ATP-dependent sacrificial sulfur transferase LarE [Candidatus Omnitrophota bacterium]
MKTTKVKKLNELLQQLKRVVVAYSGGLDSTFLLKMAVDTLDKDNVLAVTARSETYPLAEYKEAKKYARLMGVEHLTIHTSELAIKNFASNPVNRCYYCKKELFKKLDSIKRRHRMSHVVDGTNLDDLKDIRHGRLAAGELGVRSPLLEAGLTKSDIRKFSRDLGLPTWDKPSFACLASRFPFRSRIDRAGLLRVDRAEAFLHGLGFKQVRVRIHNDTARVEVMKGDFARAVKSSDLIVRELKKLKFVYVTLDLAGYRTGSMHEAV